MRYEGEDLPCRLRAHAVVVPDHHTRWTGSVVSNTKREEAGCRWVLTKGATPRGTLLRSISCLCLLRRVPRMSRPSVSVFG